MYVVGKIIFANCENYKRFKLTRLVTRQAVGIGAIAPEFHLVDGCISPSIGITLTVVFKAVRSCTIGMYHTYVYIAWYFICLRELVPPTEHQPDDVHDNPIAANWRGLCFTIDK